MGGGTHQALSEEAAEALSRRLEAQAARLEAQRAAQAEAARIETERLAAAQAAQNPPIVGMTAAETWDPLGDDPEANHNDGQVHPDEDAISNRDALHEAKRDAWIARAERLNDQGKVLAALRAESHAEWHGWRVLP
jgi:hypothetical protein